MHPRSKQCYFLDYVVVRQRDLKAVLHTRVMPSAECLTDHRLVRSILKLQFKPKFKKKGNFAKLNIDSLRREDAKAKFQGEIQQKLTTTPYHNDRREDAKAKFQGEIQQKLTTTPYHNDRREDAKAKFQGEIQQKLTTTPYHNDRASDTLS